MTFIVLGAGAIGGYVGGRLAAAGQDVRWVARPAMADQLRARGLRVTDLDGADLAVPAAALQIVTRVAELEVGPDSLVLLCVKGGATQAAAAELAATCPPDTPVISLQNGVDNVARIRAAAPGLSALAGMVPFNVVSPSPGHCHRATSGEIWLSSDNPCPHIANIFIASGIPTRLSADMPAVQWGKLLLNLNNPVNALSDLPLVQQLADRNFRRVLALLQSEALAVLKQAGIRPAQVGATSPALLPHILRLPNWAFTRLAARMLRMDAQARSSMWDDLRQGRVTEVDDLCGAVVRLAAAHGRSAPANAAMVRRVSAHTPGQRHSGASLLDELGKAL